LIVKLAFVHAVLLPDRRGGWPYAQTVAKTPVTTVGVAPLVQSDCFDCVRKDRKSVRQSGLSPRVTLG
jgi:hypothetical protein